MALLRMRFLRLAALIRRHPYLHAFIGFSAGLASFVLVDRQNDSAAIIAIGMLVIWVVLILEQPIARIIKRIWGAEPPRVLLYFTTQIVHQESFFFVLPFLLITTNWLSLQSGFTLLICAAALISILDPVYARYLASHRWRYLVYHALALFVVLLTVLPIVLKLTTLETYFLSTILALAFAFPSLFRLIPLRGWRGTMGLIAVTLGLGLLAWTGRHMVPPVPLWVTQATMTTALEPEDREVKNSVRTVSQQDLLRDGIYAYTAIRAPRGLHEEIHHAWSHQGTHYDRIPVEITGGRKAGYRMWTHKNNFPADPSGQWTVEIETESGQRLAVLRFMVEK